MNEIPCAESIHFAMGTEIMYKVFGTHAQEAVTAAKQEAKRLEGLLSRFLPQSEVSRLNASAGRQAVRLSEEVFEVLNRALGYSQLSQGLFDVTVGPLADLWDYKHATKSPAGTEIQRILPLVDYRDIELDYTNKTARLRHPGQSVDLGGIGKGFAGDRFMELFKEYGVTLAFCNIGGNMSTLGSKPDGSPWLVSIRHPRQEGLLGAVAVTGKAVVTSGDYERYFIDDEGRRYHHILNSATGYPAQSGLISVTVIAENGMAADALSTAVFVSGLEKGYALIKKGRQAEMVCVDAKLQVYLTQGIKDCFQSACGIKTNLIE